MGATEKIARFIADTGYEDIPRGDPALPLTDDELLTKYRECARSQLRPDDIERSVDLVLGLERVADIGTLIATLRSPSSVA